MFFFFKQKTAYEMRISDWSSDVCSSDLDEIALGRAIQHLAVGIHDLKFHSKQRPRRRSGLQGRSPRQGRDHRTARFGLPPGEIGRASCRDRVVSVRVDLGGRRIITKKK